MTKPDQAVIADTGAIEAFGTHIGQKLDDLSGAISSIRHVLKGMDK